MQQEAFWDQRAQKYDDDIQRHDVLYTRTIDRTRSLLSVSDAVLDLGCASGEIGLDLAPHVRRVHGIDVSLEMIELANQKVRQQQAGNAGFSHADAFDPSLAAGSFSAVTAFNILHLQEDIPAVLVRLHELLHPGGLLVSQTPCLGERNWLTRSLIGLAQRTGLAPPICSLTYAELESLVVSSGFEILESQLWDQKDAIQRVVARKPGAVPRGFVTEKGPCGDPMR